MTQAIDRIVAFHSTPSFGSDQSLQEAEENVRGLYQSLVPDEVQQLVNLALESNVPGKVGLAEDVLRNLVCLQLGSLAPFHGRLLDHQLYYPAVIFQGAHSAIATRILDVLSGYVGANSLTTDHMLRALAWIGDDVVQHAFDLWRRNPPKWASSLHVPPHVYAQQAGWELTPDGSRRNLFLRECHPLVTPGSENADPGVLKVAVEHEDVCQWCGHKMTTMLDLNLSHPELAFLGIHGQRLRIATCQACTCYGTVFTKSGFDGTAKWSEQNTKPGYLPDDTDDWSRMRADALVFRNRPRHWIEGADWCSLAGSCSQVGGHPTWIQDAYYPECPRCGRLMVFIAQLAVEDIEEYGEGIYYMYLCSLCGVGATHYQQS